MTHSLPLTNETLGCLRNCNLMEQGKLGELTFVRCIPTKAGSRLLPALDARLQAARVVADINDEGAVVACHETYGWYVRVATSSTVYKLICRMKS